MLIFCLQSGCELALGLRQGTIEDSALSASSYLDQFHGAAEARLNGSTGWCGDDGDKNPYLVVGRVETKGPYCFLSMERVSSRKCSEYETCIWEKTP